MRRMGLTWASTRLVSRVHGRSHVARPAAAPRIARGDGRLLGWLLGNLQRPRSLCAAAASAAAAAAAAEPDAFSTKFVEYKNEVGLGTFDNRRVGRFKGCLAAVCRGGRCSQGERVAQVDRDAFEELVLGSGRMTDVVHK